MTKRKSLFLSFLIGLVSLPAFGQSPPLGPTLQVQQGGVVIQPNTKILNFTSGCTITASGTTALASCSGGGGGGAVDSVQGTGKIACTPTTGNVVCSHTTTGSAGAKGSASSVPVFTTDSTGHVSANTNTAIAIDASQTTSGTFACAREPALTGSVLSSAGSCSTTLSSTGVSAGSYTNANITVTAEGRISTASSGLPTPYFNILSFGATGDGTTDDAPAIQLAFNAACAVAGGTVVIPPTRANGTAAIWAWKSAVSLNCSPAGIGPYAIFGLSGPGATVLLTAAAASPYVALKIDNAALVTVEGIRFFGTMDTANPAVEPNPISALIDIDNVTVRNCEFNGFILNRPGGSTCLDPDNAIIYAQQAQIEDTVFASVGGSCQAIVRVRDYVSLSIVRSRWIDFYTINTVNMTPAVNNYPYGAIAALDPLSTTGSSPFGGGTVYINGIQLDEGSGGASEQIVILNSFPISRPALPFVRIYSVMESVAPTGSSIGIRVEGAQKVEIDSWFVREGSGSSKALRMRNIDEATVQRTYTDVGNPISAIDVDSTVGVLRLLDSGLSASGSTAVQTVVEKTGVPGNVFNYSTAGRPSASAVRPGACYWDTTAGRFTCSDGSSNWVKTGTVNSVICGTGFTGGTITDTGTCAADFGTASSKIAQGNDSRFCPTPSVGNNGQCCVSNGSAWVAAACGSGGGVNATSIQGVPVSSSSPVASDVLCAVDVGGGTINWQPCAQSVAAPGTAGHMLIDTGSAWGSQAMSGDATLASGGALTLANSGVSAGTYGAASQVGVCAFDVKGRATSCTNTSIAIAGTQITSSQVPAARGGTAIDTSGSTGVPRVSAGTWSILSVLTAALGGTGIDTSGSTGIPSITAGTWAVITRITAALGGTGIDTSASTGVPTISSGTWSVNTLLPVNRGGTNASAIGSAGSIPYSSGGTAYGFSNAYTAGYPWLSGGSGAPVAVLPTGIGIDWTIGAGALGLTVRSGQQLAAGGVLAHGGTSGNTDASIYTTGSVGAGGFILYQVICKVSQQMVSSDHTGSTTFTFGSSSGGSQYYNAIPAITDSATVGTVIGWSGQKNTSAFTAAQDGNAVLGSSSSIYVRGASSGTIGTEVQIMCQVYGGPST